MTEDTWVACTDPRRMFTFLMWHARRTSDRKMWLAVSAYLGLAGPAGPRPEGVGSWLRPEDAWSVAQDCARLEPSATCDGREYLLPRYPGECYQPLHRLQCQLYRDVFGPLPFRPVPLDPVWRSADVVSLAEAAYDDSALLAGTLDPHSLALLADALEDAGCGSAEILAHLRAPGPHVRGCWAVDLVLGRE